MDARIVRCRMLNSKNDPCSAEALDPDGEALICGRHAALVLELVARRSSGLLGVALDDVRHAREDTQAARTDTLATLADLREIRSGLDDIRATLRTVASNG